MNTSNLKNMNRLMWLANVKQFYPERSIDSIMRMQQQWLDWRAEFQQLYQHSPIEYIRKQIATQESPLPSRALLLTFHFGPYRLLPRYLIAMGYKITVLAADKLIDREQSWYAEALRKEGLPQDQIAWIAATDPMVLRKIVQHIQSDRLMIVYIDANEGTARGDSEDYSKHWKVHFKDHYFYWRFNLLKLALRLGIPMYSAYMQRDASGLWAMGRVHPIMLNDQQDSDELLLKAMGNLQNVFYTMIAHEDSAWENWAYIHLYNGEEALNKRMTNRGGWVMPIHFRDKLYLFDLRSRQFFEIVSKKSENM